MSNTIDSYLSYQCELAVNCKYMRHLDIKYVTFI